MSALTFDTMYLPLADRGPEAPLPDLMGILNVQNQTDFDLGEEDELYQGYGQRSNGYPYRIYTEYTRELRQTPVRRAVLENRLLRAVFLPDFGGRLWELTDKTTGRELVYRNDVLRGSNLAVRGPWFSGGVEWNLGVIGHTPLTMETVFAARLDTPRGPVLRMYAYERIRALAYQMDFWLDPEKPALNCHMAVFNQNDRVVPMYWWSNIASPLYPGGRIFVPAHRAYTQAGGTVHAVSIPMDGQVDVSRYESIPVQRDYFFELDQQAPRWLAHVDRQGRGLLHSSTRRLQSRKLFVWGNTRGGQHWQEFLTEKAGPYLEVQAGVGKTQYGCIPMSPQTVWQWTERYEALDLKQDVQQLDFESTSRKISGEYFPQAALEQAEAEGRAWLRLPAQVVIRGSGDAELASAVRLAQGMGPLTPHLDFGTEDPKIRPWLDYVADGVLPQTDPGEPPAYDLTGDWFRSRMERHRDSWYGCYLRALLQAEAGREDLAEQAAEDSLALQETAWAWYVKAVLLLKKGDREACRKAVLRCFALGRQEAPFVKLLLQVLGVSESWETILDLPLCPELLADDRVRVWRVKALTALGRDREALALIEENGGLAPADTRECEADVGRLWQELQYRLTGRTLPVPYAIQFLALEEN